MFARALVVLLLVLNLGVAAWWALRVPATPPDAALQPAGVPLLRLVGEPATPVSPEASASAAPAPRQPAVAPLPADAVCLSFGPFTDAAALASARTTLQPQVLRMRVAQRAAGRARGWRVVVPPLATPEAAVALAERIRAAGISEYFVMREGVDANAIALGRYRSEAAAREHAAKVAAAGFAAQAEPVGGGPLRDWIDVAATAGASPTPSPEVPRVPLDCALFGPVADAAAPSG